MDLALNFQEKGSIKSINELSEKIDSIFQNE